MAIGFNLSNKIGSAGAEVYIDDVKTAVNEIRLKKHDIMPSMLLYDFYNGSAVVFNNEIHMLGGSSPSSSSTGLTKHYKFNPINGFDI